MPHPDSFFPFREPITFQGLAVRANDVISAFEPILTQDRIERIAEVIPERSFDVAVVMDQMCDAGNQSALMRTAEAFGFVNVHSTNSDESFKAERRVSRGANKWIEKTEWTTSEECCSRLLAQGFQIAVTSPDAESTIDDLPLNAPVAIVFGNERDGVSVPFRDSATQSIRLPMYGFVASLNVSVAAGILFSRLKERRQKEPALAPGLSQHEQKILRAVYYLRSTKHAEQVLRDYLNSSPSHTAADHTL